jgi:hypothetical protein
MERIISIEAYIEILKLQENEWKGKFIILNK